jgi:hypothetical protein
MDSKIKIGDKECEILRIKVKELETDLLEKESLLLNLRSRGSKTERDWEARLEEELGVLRKKISLQYQENISKL